VQAFDAGPERRSLRPLVDALVRVLDMVGEEHAQELRAEIGPLQAAVGDYSGAAATVTLIEDAYFADQARARVIERMCENGETKGAEVLAGELQDPEASAAARKAIVHERAKKKVDAALETYAAGIKEQPWRDDVRLDLAVAKARDGALDAGLALANAIGKSETRALALTQIAEHLVEERKLERVEELIASIEDAHSRSSAWAAIASAHTRAGDVPAAEAALARVTDPWSALEVAIALARCEAVQKDAEQSARFLRTALELLRRAQTPSEVSAARRRMAELLANAGNSSEALRIAQSAPPDERDGVLLAVGTGLALHGALDEIDRLQAAWKNVDDRASLLVGAAGVLAERASAK
jgi:tetratricopeptide (TPR) repeat protein